VLVAHSIGGPYAMTFTKYYGSDVVGLVFVDASHPDQVKRFREVTSMTLAQATKPLKVAATLGRTGFVRAMAGRMGGVPNEPDVTTRATAAYSPTSLKAMLKEVDALDTTLAEAGTIRQLGDRPVFVLTAGAPPSADDKKTMQMNDAQAKRYVELWDAMQADETAWSTRGQRQVVPDATHYIQFDRPDAVIKAVRTVVDSVRARPAAQGS
jgi:pimeloyl-ACP methyl ester carboxylesterase